MFRINPVHCSRSKSTTWQRKGRLLIFQSNSTDTSHHSTKMLGLGNNLLNNYESIATKVCCGGDQLLKIIISCVTDKPSIT